jgi:hypothetical protein
LFNTIVNAFVAFLARRLSQRDGLPIGAEEAFARLGIYGGDDGLTADINPKIYQNAARTIGQELTIEPVLRGCIGIKFLARIYSPNVWFGDSSNMCDIPRQLAKFHTCVRMNSNVTPIMKLLEKVRSFSLSDLNTPIIGHFCSAVIRENRGEPAINELTAPIRSWLSRYTSDNQYNNTPGAWMLDEAERLLPEFNYNKFKVWCATTISMSALLSPPMFMAPIVAKSAIPVIVDGELPLGTPFFPTAPQTPVELAKGSTLSNKDLTRPTGTNNKEKKVNADLIPEFELVIEPLPSADIKIDTKPVDVKITSDVKIAPVASKPIKTVTFDLKTDNKSYFEEYKKKKLAAGTWVDKPQRPKLSHDEFLKLKEVKIKAGTWKDKPRSQKPVQSTSAVKSNWRSSKASPGAPPPPLQGWRRV